MKFVDKTEAYVRAGDGGNGCVSFQRRRFQPRGGPGGGDGGRGGNVVFVAEAQMTNLLKLPHLNRFIAENGQPGRGDNQSGRKGKDLVIKVPVGTLLLDSKVGNILQDLNEGEARFVAARGGKGGRGNAKFATSVDRAPRRAEKGESGEYRWLRIELKLRADVGLIGPPNTGKSTLISRISSARPRIADYPFTTTSPNLGVVAYDDFRSFTMVDVPGLIKDAHKGCGLGAGFLKHVERTELLVHVLDITRLPNHSPLEDYEMVMKELKAYAPLLGEKADIVAINKVDLLQNPQLLEETERAFRRMNIQTVLVSALTGQGLNILIDKITRKLDKRRSNVQERGTGGKQETPTQSP